MFEFKPIIGVQPKPCRVMIYGESGLGKSTLAGMFPSPIFIDIEDRLSHLNVNKLPLCKYYKNPEFPESSFDEQIGWIAKAPHDYKTLVIDTSDWLESLIHANLCNELEIDDLSETGYGRGYNKAAAVWQNVIAVLSHIQNSRKMNIVFTSHCHTVKFSDPAGEAWDKYSPKLRKLPNAQIIEWMDYVFLVRVKAITKTVQEGFDKKTKASSRNRDIALYSRCNPTYIAKCSNTAVPDEIPLDEFADVIKIITHTKQETEK